MNDLFIEFEWNSNYLLELVFNDFSLYFVFIELGLRVFSPWHMHKQKSVIWNENTHTRSAYRTKNKQIKKTQTRHTSTNATIVNRREQNYLCKRVLWIHNFLPSPTPNHSTSPSLSISPHLMQADKKINGHLTHFIVQCSTFGCVHYSMIIDHYYLLYILHHVWMVL